MDTTLRLNRNNFYDITTAGRRLLFHIPTTALFAVDRVGVDVLDFLKERSEVTEEDILRRFEGVLPASEVVETLRELRRLHIFEGEGMPAQLHKPPHIEEFPLSTIVLNVNTGCNLSCTYCYKEDLATPSKGEKMDLETASQSIELLLKEGHSRKQINVVFFGGEPLSNLPLIKKVVEYAECRCAEEGKSVNFSLTTNATLLTEQIVDYLDQHCFGISVSMDGPRSIHDLRRKTVGGMGTYDVVARKAKMLLKRYQSRPVGARVTLTGGVTNVIEIHKHLKHDIGFFEIGFAPVTTNPISQFNLTDEELKEVFEQMKILGLQYKQAALRDENNGFSNMHQLMTDMYRGTRKSLPCGAGVGLLAVDKDGELNLCHRFTGSELPTYGNVARGIDKMRLGAFLEEAANREGKVCATCRIRNLCAGGCYHESYARYSDPLMPTYHYCDLMREWVDFGIEVYSEILHANPKFFARHVTTRSTEL